MKRAPVVRERTLDLHARWPLRRFLSARTLRRVLSPNEDVTADEAMFDSHLDDALRGRRFDVLAPETATEVP
jgi:hypothetical protein